MDLATDQLGNAFPILPRFHEVFQGGLSGSSLSNRATCSSM
jgi:hypothetical protein